jgi:signal transduction histidine kinase
MGLEMLGGSVNASARDEVARNIGELDQLIEEILLASRLDAREADLGTVESIDLAGLCAEECARIQAGMDAHGVALVAPGVAKLLRRAVRNLLENARKHAQGHVTLSLRQEQDFALIQVIDDGPGVPLKHQERIFEPFYRLPGASERDGGVGLGLALVKSIAQRHGGSVLCRTPLEGGACFEIRIPLSQASLLPNYSVKQ